MRAGFEPGKTASNVVRATVCSPDLYFKSNEIWFSKIFRNLSVRYYKAFRKFHESVSTAKEYTFMKEAMTNKTKELIFLKFNHIRDQPHNCNHLKLEYMSTYS